MQPRHPAPRDRAASRTSRVRPHDDHRSRLTGRRLRRASAHRAAESGSGRPAKARPRRRSTRR
jgi:hypothetical protein